MSEGRIVRVVAGEDGCRAARRAGAVAVVVDALRASATITALTEAGARPLWVTMHLAQARRLRDRLGDGFLVGERYGLPPAGFDIGNSPRQAAALPVAERPVVFTSTTGAVRLVQLEGAPSVLVGGPVNASAVAELAAQRAGDGSIYVIAAGLRGRPGGTGEDWLGAGLLAQELVQRGFEWEERGRHRGRWPDEITPELVARELAASANGRRLAGIGLGQDVEDCGRVDWLSAVAEVVGYEELGDGPPAAELRAAG